MMQEVRQRIGWFGCLVAALMFSFSVGRSGAQQVFGSVYGTVTDSSGAAVANARVSIRDINKGTETAVQTNESGNYTKGQLIPGSYEVQIEAQGFSKAVSSPVTVAVDLAARFDAQLKVGNVNEQVEVTARPHFCRLIGPTFRKLSLRKKSPRYRTSAATSSLSNC